MTQPDTGYAPVENGELYYEVQGSGPAIVFIHAGVADHTMWEPQVQALAGTHTVVTYDTRGFGRSRTESKPFSNRDDLRRLMEHIGIARATLVGCSRGGQIALDTALEFPDLASGLVWVCGGVGGLDHDPPDGELEWFMKLESLWEARDWNALVPLEVHTWADGIEQPEGRAPEWLRRRVHDMIMDAYTREDGDPAPIPLDPSAAERLDMLVCPLLVIIGDLDTSGTRASAEALSLLPGARIVHFADSAHLPSMEHSERFNAALLDFLRDNGL